MYALLLRSVLTHVCLLLLVLASLPAAYAQTTLNPGDIAIVGFNYDNPDDFSFVALVDIDAGTEINFTDNGWFAAGGFRDNEGTFTWTASSAISAGTVVNPAVSGVAFSGSGDQILAYQGTDASPSFVYALNSEGSPGQWQSDATSSNTSALPTGLVNGETAVAVDEIDNALYTGITSGTCTDLQQAIGDKSNWSGSDTIRETMPSGPLYTVTAACGGGMSTPDLVINEILADPDGTTGDANGDGTVNTVDDEFVEIVNTSSSSVDISGYTIADGFSTRHTFPGGTILDAGASIVVFGGGTPTGIPGLSQTASSGSLGLNNGGDTVTLADGSAATLDEVTYGSEGGSNQSLTRDPDLTGTFVQHSTATGSGGSLFSPGARVDGTPFTAPPPALVINEILADPAGDITGDANGDGTRDGTDDEFVEIVNTGSTSIDISGYTIADGFSTRHTFPGGTILDAGASIVVFGGGTPTGIPGLSQTASSGSLGLNNGGDTVTLADGSAATLDEVTYGSEGGSNQSLTRDPDLTGTFVQHSTATGSGGSLFSPGARVDGTPFTAPPPALVINEILADPAGDITGDANGDGTRDGTDDEFVEIVNTGSTSIDISGYTIADGFSTRHTFPGGTILDAGASIVVFGGGTPTGIPGLSQTASSGSLGLNNGGDTVTLADGSAATLDEVTYGSEGGSNQSLTRDPDLTGSFVQHSTATGSGGALFSPGTRIDGTPFTSGGGTANDGDGTAVLANATAPLNGTDIFRRGIAGQTLEVTVTGVDTGSLESVSVTVPADWNGLSIGNVTLSGAGFASATPSVSSQTITVTGAALTDADTGTISISGLMPRTPTSATDDGRDIVTVETAISSGTLTAIADSPTAYVTIPLSSLRDVDGNGVPLDDGETVAVEGVASVSSGVFDSNNLSVYIQDATAGMFLFDTTLDPVILEGNQYAVKGSVVQFNGLTEVVPAMLGDVVDLGAATAVAPTPLTISQIMANPEGLEGTLATITGVSIVSGSWPPAGSSASLTITDDGGTSLMTLRIDSDTNIDGTPEPSGTFDVTGPIGQFDNSSPFTDGYQILPRSTGDISTLDVPVFQFARAFSVHLEADGSTSVAVTLTNPDDTMPADVTVSFSSGTGDAGTDLSGFTAQTLTFPAGSTTPQTVNFTFVDDGDNTEAVEYLTFALSTSDGLIGSRGTFTLWLMDNAVPTTTLFPGQTGATLISSIQSVYGNPMTLGYDIARDTMYGVIDYDAVGQQVCGIYGGYCAPLIFPGQDPSSTVFQGGDGISAEHVFPRSKGADQEPELSDIHNLFPTKQTINSARSNYPFAEIVDAETDTWYINDIEQSTIPGSNIEDYSELDRDINVFEPRHDAKGKVARAAFYFRTIHESVADLGFFDTQKDDLYTWHLEQGVTADEALRNVMIAAYQGNKLNPFIIDPTLANRAFGFAPAACADTNTAPFWDGSILPQGAGVAYIPIQAQTGLSTVDIGVPTTNLALREIRSADGSTVLTDFTGSDPIAGDGAGAGCDDGFGTLTFTGTPGSEPTDVLLVICSPQENQSSRFFIEVQDACPMPRTLRVDPVLDLFATNTDAEVGLPAEFSLEGNYPNPFNPETIIGYALPEASDVRVVVYDLLGRQVRVLADGFQEPGRFEVRWNGRDSRGVLMPSGTYLYRLEANTFQQTRRMTLLK